MLKSKTLVYIGDLPVYNFHETQHISFPKGLPITVDERLEYFLSADDFESFDRRKHRKPKTDIQPILVKLPQTLNNMLPCIQALRVLRRWYPYHKLIACYPEPFDFLIQDISDVETIDFFVYDVGRYYKQILCNRPKNSSIFDGGAEEKFTHEFCYLQLLGINFDLTESDNTIPHLIKHDGKPGHITIINLGEMIHSCWKDFGNYLSEQNWGKPVQVIDKKISLKKAYEILKNSLFVLTTGDSPMTLLATYLGVPTFSFFRDTQIILRHQLYLFNNIKPDSFNYSPFRTDKEFSDLFQQLKNNIVDVILAGKQVTKIKEQKAPVSIPKDSTTPRVDGTG